MTRPTAKERVGLWVDDVVQGRERSINFARVVQIVEEHAAAEVEAETAELARERDEARAEVERLREAIRSAVVAMGAESCLAGRCPETDEDAAPCPWTLAAAALAPEAKEGE